MDRIVEKLKRFGYIEEKTEDFKNTRVEKGSVEEIFYSEDGILPDVRGGMSWDVREEKEAMFPWERREREGERREKRRSTSLAELTLPETELRRLRHVGMRMKSRVKVGGSGLTGEIVGRIHERWKEEEVVRVKCEGASALNMKRTHEILEVNVI